MPSIAATRPVATHTFQTTSTTDWDVLSLPAWVREVTIQAPSGGPTVSVSTSESGAYAAADHRVELAPGQSVTLRLAPGRAVPGVDTRDIAVHTGAVGSLVHVLLEE